MKIIVNIQPYSHSTAIKMSRRSCLTAALFDSLLLNGHCLLVRTDVPKSSKRQHFTQSVVTSGGGASSRGYLPHLPTRILLLSPLGLSNPCLIHIFYHSFPPHSSSQASRFFFLSSSIVVTAMLLSRGSLFVSLLMDSWVFKWRSLMEFSFF